jgi:hypothetical protein
MKKLKAFYDWVLYHNTPHNEKPSAIALMVMFVIMGMAIFFVISWFFPWFMLTIPASVIVWAWKDFNKDT